MPQLRGPTGNAGADQQLAMGAVKAPHRAVVVGQIVKTVR
jgi:hypothetical protein